MKKFLVVAVVLAALCISSVAFALDVTLSGEAAVRSRMFYNIAASPQPNSHADATNDNYTQTRFLLEVNIKADNNVKGKLALWNDFDTWGMSGRGPLDTNRGYAETGTSGNTTSAGTGATSSAYIREAWIDFMVPGLPVGVKAGRMLNTLGQGWFERSTYGGQDAWVVYANLGKATVALQDVKLAEGTTNVNRDDVDLYTALVTVKPADGITIGADVSYLLDNNAAVLQATTAGGSGYLMNFGVNWNAKVGIATIKGEVDVQKGRVQTTAAVGGIDYDGFQGIIQATVPVSIVTFNAGAAYGSGNRPGSSNRSQVVTLLDIGQHYSLIYEYRLRGAGLNAASAYATNMGLANTMMVNAGAMVQVAKSLAVGLDAYWFKAAEWVALNGSANASKDLGFETDLKVNWQITPNLSWNWQAGWFATGAAYRDANGINSDCYAIQGILSLKF